MFWKNVVEEYTDNNCEFKNKIFNKDIEVHKPHPKNILKRYQINDVLKNLKEWGIL